MTAQWPEGEHYNAPHVDGWKVELLAMYLRNRIAEESPVWHFMPMAKEAWHFINNDNNNGRQYQ
jgi:hypothetical protein